MVEQLVVDPFAEQDQHPVAAADEPEQLGARGRQLVGPDLGVAGRPDGVEPGVGDQPRDEDPRARAAGRHAPYGSIERMANVTFAGRSARRRMYHGYQCSPYAISVSTR